MISPIAPLLHQDGVAIALISVEIWPKETVVRMAVLVADPVAEEALHERDVEAWAKAGRAGAPPEGRGNRLFEGVEVSLSDDVGTSYEWKARSVGGSGRLFRADWWFPIGVPDVAQVLTVVAKNKETGDSGTTDLDLT